MSAIDFVLNFRQIFGISSLPMKYHTDNNRVQQFIKNTEHITPFGYEHRLLWLLSANRHVLWADNNDIMRELITTDGYINGEHRLFSYLINNSSYKLINRLVIDVTNKIDESWLRVGDRAVYVRSIIPLGGIHVVFLLDLKNMTSMNILDHCYIGRLPVHMIAKFLTGTSLMNLQSIVDAYIKVTQEDSKKRKKDRRFKYRRFKYIGLRSFSSVMEEDLKENSTSWIIDCLDILRTIVEQSSIFTEEEKQQIRMHYNAYKLLIE